VFAPAGVEAVAALPDGRLVAARASGVEVLLFNAGTGQFEVTAELVPQTGIPSEPDALAVLQSEFGEEVLVTQAGSDTLFVFAFAAPADTPFDVTFAGPSDVPLPGLPESSPIEPGATPLSAEPLVVVVALLPGGLPLDSASEQAAGGSGADNTPQPPALRNTLPALAPLAGEEEQTPEEPAETLPAAGGPDPLDALRDLPLFPPDEDGTPPAPRKTDGPGPVPGELPDAGFPDPTPDRKGEDSRAGIAPPPAVETAVGLVEQPATADAGTEIKEVAGDGNAPSHLGREQPAGPLPHEGPAAGPGWTARVNRFARHGLSLLAVFGLSWLRPLAARQRLHPTLHQTIERGRDCRPRS
jgi:hypothetical protein